MVIDVTWHNALAESPEIPMGAVLAGYRKAFTSIGWYLYSLWLKNVPLIFDGTPFLALWVVFYQAGSCRLRALIIIGLLIIWCGVENHLR